MDASRKLVCFFAPAVARLLAIAVLCLAPAASSVAMKVPIDLPYTANEKPTQETTENVLAPHEIGLRNDSIEVRLDLSTGGAICYLTTWSGTRSIVNIFDRGRYIQQSYYAGPNLDRKAEGQSKAWSPWPWNPIGAGDAYGNPAKVLESRPAGGTRLTSGALYAKTRPLLWDMKGEEAQCDFETTITLGSGASVHVINRLTCFRTDTRWPEALRDQELPAVYTTGEFYRLFTYQGDQPWTGAPLTEVKNSGPPWAAWSTPEHWAALVNDKNWGLGVYNARCTEFTGGFCGKPGSGGPRDNATGYIAPLRKETLGLTTVYQYEYDVVVGPLDEIREWVYAAEGK